MNGTIWIVAIIAGVALVILFRLLASRRAVAGRQPLAFEEMHRSVADKVSLTNFVQVFRALGDAYGLDPRLIRPEDSLARLLAKDSWALDAGTEKLNKWLNSIGVDETSPKPSTVLDLLKLVEDRRKNDPGTSPVPSSS